METSTHGGTTARIGRVFPSLANVLIGVCIVLIVLSRFMVPSKAVEVRGIPQEVSPLATIMGAQAAIGGTSVPISLTDAEVPLGAVLVISAKLTPAGIDKGIQTVQFQVGKNPKSAAAVFDASHEAIISASTAGLTVGPHTMSLEFSSQAGKHFASEKAALFTVISAPIKIPRVTSLAVAACNVDLFDALDSDAPSRRDGMALHRTQSLFIEGWAYDQVGKSTATVIVVIDGRAAFSTESGISRGDVAAYMKNSSYLHSGYAAVIPMAAIAPGKHSVGILVAGKNSKVYTSSTRNLHITVLPK